MFRKPSEYVDIGRLCSSTRRLRKDSFASNARQRFAACSCKGCGYCTINLKPTLKLLISNSAYPLIGTVNEDYYAVVDHTIL